VESLTFPKRMLKTLIEVKMGGPPKWPCSQNDPVWAEDLMWDYDKVVKIHVRYNHASERKVKSLLRHFPKGGNSIGNEGCLLACLAMVLTLLSEERWTPKFPHVLIWNLLLQTPLFMRHWYQWLRLHALKIKNT
jgi:hypothetical protein